MAEIINPEANEPKPSWETYGDELGVQAPDAPLSDGQKRERDQIAALPHVSRSSSETRENLAEMREENTLAVRQAIWVRQEELSEAHEEERLGRLLHASQFIQMLWRCGLVAVYTRCNVSGLRSLKGEAATRERRAAFERSMAGLTVQGSTLVSLPEPKYATWVQIPVMPEYSVMRFDTHNLPTSEKYRGWRTVLIELIRQNFVTEARCNEVFGRPTGPAARRWLEIMQSIRTNQGIA